MSSSNMSTSLAASEVRKKNVPRRMFGKKARKNKAIQSWRRAAQLIIPVAHTIGAVSISLNFKFILSNFYTP